MDYRVVDEVEDGEMVTQSSFARRPVETLVSLLIAVVVVGMFIAVLRWATAGDFPPMDGSMMTGAASVLGIVVMVFFGLALAGIAIWALFTVSPLARGAPWGGPKEWSTMAAVTELKKRYARGMVSREEYLRTLQDLEGPQAPAAPPPASPAPAASAQVQGPVPRQL